MTWALKSLKNFRFNGILFSKVYIVWATKVQESYFSWHTEDLLKFWRKTDFWFEKWHEKCGKFLPEHLKVSKLRLWWDPFVQSRKGVSLNFTEELCVMKMNNDTKIEEAMTCRFKIDMKSFTNFDLSSRKSKKVAL